jgi:hypothetical protein
MTLERGGNAMINRVLLIGLAAAIFLGAGYFRAESLQDSAFRYAEAARELCYARQGYDPRSIGSAPQPVVAECIQPMADYQAGENGRYLAAALLAAAIAAIVVGAVALILSRRPPQPPAG